jgi:hypothetical protein
MDVTSSRQPPSRCKWGLVTDETSSACRGVLAAGLCFHGKWGWKPHWLGGWLCPAVASGADRLCEAERLQSASPTALARLRTATRRGKPQLHVTTITIDRSRIDKMAVCRFYQQGYCRNGSTKVAFFSFLSRSSRMRDANGNPWVFRLPIARAVPMMDHSASNTFMPNQGYR